MTDDKTWSPALEEELRKLVGEGKSGGQISKELNLTRSAVVSKVHRMGLTLRGYATGSVEGKINDRRSDRQYHPSPGVVVESRLKPLAMPPPEPTTGSPAAEALFALPLGACKWPIGDVQSQDFKFCGVKAVSGRPYCLIHIREAGSLYQRKVR